MLLVLMAVFIMSTKILIYENGILIVLIYVSEIVSLQSLFLICSSGKDSSSDLCE